MTQFVRHRRGEHVWSVVRVPTVAAEDARQLHRELDRLKAERRAHRTRMHALLVTHGVDLKVGAKLLHTLPPLVQWDGQPLPPGLRARLRREFHRLQLVNQHVRELEHERQQLLATSQTPAVEQAKLPAELCGIGPTSSWVFVMEFFSWREFGNRRQVAAPAGLTPTPYQNGGAPREQGISEAGNPRLRTMVIEIAWSWLRHQPESALTQWLWARFGTGSLR